MTLNLSIVELTVLFFCAVTLGIVIHFFITSRRSLKSPSIETEKNKQIVDEWKLKYFNQVERKEHEMEETKNLLAEAQESSQSYKEQVEELRRQQSRTLSELESGQKVSGSTQKAGAPESKANSMEQLRMAQWS